MAKNGAILTQKPLSEADSAGTAAQGLSGRQLVSLPSAYTDQKASR